MRALFVVVSGAPGSGKSTLARELAPLLDLPLLMKDTIKEAIADELGAANPAESKRLGAATMNVLLALARQNRGAVIESTWVPELSRPALRDLRPIVEVFVEVPVEEAFRRYRERAGTRHFVHFDHDVDEAAIRERARAIGGDWPLVTVDGTRDYDIEAIVEQILSA